MARVIHRRPRAFRASSHLPAPPDTVELDWRINLNRQHPYLALSGYSERFVNKLELGVGTDRLEGRLVIPVHNVLGNLTGYIGRWTGDPVPRNCVKYQYAGSAEAEVLNLFGAIVFRSDLPLTIVTDPMDYLHLRRNAVESVVSLIGEGINDVQLRRLTYHFPGHPFTVVCDETEQGRKLRMELALRLGCYSPVKAPEFLSDGRTVQSLTREEIMEEL